MSADEPWVLPDLLTESASLLSKFRITFAGRLLALGLRAEPKRDLLHGPKEPPALPLGHRLSPINPNPSHLSGAGSRSWFHGLRRFSCGAGPLVAAAFCGCWGQYLGHFRALRSPATAAGPLNVNSSPALKPVGVIRGLCPPVKVALYTQHGLGTAGRPWSW